MRILIDGYNLIRAVPELAALDRDDLQLGREALLASLASYRALRGHPLVVAFDGSLSPPPQAPRGVVPVLFSRGGSSADDLIAARCLAGEADLLVTSDAGLTARVGRSVEVVPSAEFWERVELALAAEVKGEVPEVRRGGERGVPGKRRPKRERRGQRARARL